MNGCTKLLSRLALLLTSSAFFLLGGEERKTVLVLHHGEEELCARVSAHFRSVAEQKGLAFPEHVVDLVRDELSGIDPASSDFEPAIVLAFGEHAVRAAEARFGDPPILAVLEERPDSWTPRPQTIVVDKPDASRQLEEITRILPMVNEIGLLYRERENGEEVARVRRRASELGVVLQAVSVGDIRDFPTGLSRVLDESAVLWCLPDEALFNDKTARSVILASFWSHTPLIGPSPSWVKAGALMCFETNDSGLVERCVAWMIALLTGEDRPLTSRREGLAFSLNLKTVDHMELSIEKSVMADAVKIYQ